MSNEGFGALLTCAIDGPFILFWIESLIPGHCETAICVLTVEEGALLTISIKASLSIMSLMRTARMERTRDLHLSSVSPVASAFGEVVAAPIRFMNSPTSIEFVADLACAECIVIDTTRSTMSRGCNPIHLTCESRPSEGVVNIG